jgi:carboxylesterase type B
LLLEEASSRAVHPISDTTLVYIVENSVSIGKPIIAVSIAYRLSGWGFLDSDALRSAGLTNLGIRDQRQALHWVQENIAPFGGDPSKVTIWGESAGAASV